MGVGPATHDRGLPGLVTSTPSQRRFHRQRPTLRQFFLPARHPLGTIRNHDYRQAERRMKVVSDFIFPDVLARASARSNHISFAVDSDVPRWSWLSQSSLSPSRPSVLS